jgi:hypothetical protein
MHHEPENSPDFIAITETLKTVLYHVNGWAHAEFKHNVLEREVQFALNNMDMETGRVDAETALRAAGGLIWAVLQSREDKSVMKN